MLSTAGGWVASSSVINESADLSCVRILAHLHNKRLGVNAEWGLQNGNESFADSPVQCRLDSQFRLVQAQNRRLAVLNPAAALEGDTPRLIDEWQLKPKLWNVVRREIDARRKPGQFIVSRSVTPADDGKTLQNNPAFSPPSHQRCDPDTRLPPSLYKANLQRKGYFIDWVELEHTVSASWASRSTWRDQNFKAQSVFALPERRRGGECGSHCSSPLFV